MNPSSSANQLLRALHVEREARQRRSEDTEVLADESTMKREKARETKGQVHQIVVLDDDDDDAALINQAQVKPGSDTAVRHALQSRKSSKADRGHSSDGLCDDADLQLAMIMQQEEDEWVDSAFHSSVSESIVANQPHSSANPLTDENVAPDAREMFLYYDKLYFGGVLTDNAVVVEWSKRMTLCAGQCSYRGRGSMCRVALSEPLLKYRRSTEVKETLLHEMIHAWQFVSRGNRDRTDHGPIFLGKMREINAAAAPDMYRPAQGYTITVFHSFRDEVELHRKHWWACARCGTLVKRAMNRPPTARDCREYRTDPARIRPCTDSRCLWHAHSSRCGGDFTKIRGPELSPPAGAGGGGGDGGGTGGGAARRGRGGSKRLASDEDKDGAGGAGARAAPAGRRGSVDGGGNGGRALGGGVAGGAMMSPILPPTAGRLLGVGASSVTRPSSVSGRNSGLGQVQAGLGTIDAWLKGGGKMAVAAAKEGPGAGTAAAPGGRLGDGAAQASVAAAAAAARMARETVRPAVATDTEGVSASAGRVLVCPVCGRGGWKSEAAVDSHLDECPGLMMAAAGH